MAVLVCAVVSDAPLQAQTRAQRVNVLQDLYGDRMMVSLVPLPLFFNGFRVDFDCRLKDDLWLQIAPQYNYRRKGDVSRTDGFCMEADLRYYVMGSPYGFYVSSGLGLDYNQISDNNRDQEFYKVNSVRLGSQLHIGYQFRLWRRAVFDFYIGAAFRYAVNSFPSSSYEAAMDKVELKPWNYQFGGIFMQTGIRIGLLL